MGRRVRRVALGEGLEAAPEVLGRGAAGLEDREVDVPVRVQLLDHAVREAFHRELRRVVECVPGRRYEPPHRAHEQDHASLLAGLGVFVSQHAEGALGHVDCTPD